MSGPSPSLHRRGFMRLAASASLGLAVSPLPASGAGAGPATDLPPAPELPNLTPARAAGDEAFWAQVRALYAPDGSLLDLDHGNSGAVPTAVLDAYLQRARQLNRAPNVHYPLLSGGEALYERIAAWLGATLDVIALLPNATTGLNTVLHGFPLERGDEVLVTDHEYPDMVETLHQRAERDGIVIRTVRVPDADAPASAMVDAVRAALTPATKLLLVSHVSAWNGEVLPVAAISAVCRARGVAVLVDAAQSVGHLPVAFDAWGCDFLALSFHKAAGAPLATGALLMRREWIGRVAPLHPPTWDYGPYPIDQYAWIGTTNVAANATVPDAIAMQERIGLARKRARLMYLASYWHARARHPRLPRAHTTATRAAHGVLGFCDRGRAVEGRGRAAARRVPDPGAGQGVPTLSALRQRRARDRAAVHVARGAGPVREGAARGGACVTDGVAPSAIFQGHSVSPSLGPQR